MKTEQNTPGVPQMIQVDMEVLQIWTITQCGLTFLGHGLIVIMHAVSCGSWRQLLTSVSTA